MTDTIFALSTGRPPTAIAVIRLSGPKAFAALAAMTRRPLPPLRTLTIRTLVDPESDERLDTGLAVRFAQHASATGEELVELHLHGGAAVIAAVTAVLLRLPGLRLANAGEFTRRAFDNGKLDLAQAEGLADLIGAETEAQRRQALLQTGGGLHGRVDAWRRALVDIRAEVEATLDFADEDGITDELARSTHAQLTALVHDVERAARDSYRAERIRDGLVVAVTGPPNAGKSSLVNALARRDVAIVSVHAGTTRDVIEVRLDLDGMAVTLLDTAGLRASDDPVEAEGIARGRTRAAAADLVIALGYPPPTAAALGVVGMADLTGIPAGWHDGVLHLSALTGAGIDALLDWLAAWARITLRPGEPAIIVRERHRLAVAETARELRAAGRTTDAAIIAEHLRRAAAALVSIIGQVTNDDVLDAVFSRFCIGK